MNYSNLNQFFSRGRNFRRSSNSKFCWYHSKFGELFLYEPLLIAPQTLPIPLANEIFSARGPAFLVDYFDYFRI